MIRILPSLGKTMLSMSLLLSGLLINVAEAQTKLPMIHAGSNKVDVRDGNHFRKAVWNLSPEIKPDTYFVLDPSKTSTVVFYTDLDSISFIIKPGSETQFVILLNGKDSCFTTISSPVPETTAFHKDARISGNLLRDDFKILIEALTTKHADVYRYTKPEILNRIIDSCNRQLTDSTTVVEFYLIVKYILSAVKDGHISAQPPQELIRYYVDSVKMFPLKPWFTDTGAFVFCSNLEEVPIGSTLLTIDGIPIDEVRKMLFRYLPSDGNIESKKYLQLNGDWFLILYTLIKGEKSAYSISFRSETGIRKTAIVKSDFVNKLDCPSRPDIRRFLELEYTKENIAKLSIRSFDNRRINENGEDFAGFLMSSFNELKKKHIERLILDIRGNGGGDDENGALLYAYLANKPFHYFKSIRSKTKNFTANDHPGLSIQQPQENSYTGMVIFLIDGASFSTTADFAAIARSNERGKFIGEETGGGYEGNNSGENFVTVLPGSKIKLLIPAWRYENAVQHSGIPGRGVIPDIQVHLSISDILAKRDVQLDAALRYYRKASSKLNVNKN